jgi:hypothetical protein
MMSFLTYITGFFMNFELLPILTEKKMDRRVEPPDTFLEENHPMTISSKFCSYRANGFRQKDFYRNFP